MDDPCGFQERRAHMRAEKGVAAPAEIEVGVHILAHTRVETCVKGRMLVEVDPARIAPSGPASPAIAAWDDLRDLADTLGGRWGCCSDPNLVPGDC
jgi:hypothetical protein